MSNPDPKNMKASNATALNRTVSNAPSTSSSGYESEGGVQVDVRSCVNPVRGSTHETSLTPYHLVPAMSLNPLLLQQAQHPSNSSGGGTNAHLLPDQYYSLMPGQAYTAPIMIATNEQLSYALGQQTPHLLSHDQPVYRQRQYSGPVLATPFNTACQKPTVSPLQFPDDHEVCCSNTSEVEKKSKSENVNAPPPPPQLFSSNNMVLPSSVPIGRSASMVTQSAHNFKEESVNDKPNRRNTAPSIGLANSQKGDSLKRAAFSLKEKSLYEEGNVFIHVCVS